MTLQISFPRLNGLKDSSCFLCALLDGAVKKLEHKQATSTSRSERETVDEKSSSIIYFLIKTWYLVDIQYFFWRFFYDRVVFSGPTQSLVVFSGLIQRIFVEAQQKETN